VYDQRTSETSDYLFIGKRTGLGAPWGLAFVAKDNAFYMCDGKNNRIIKVNPNGQAIGCAAQIQNWQVQRVRSRSKLTGLPQSEPALSQGSP